MNWPAEIEATWPTPGTSPRWLCAFTFVSTAKPIPCYRKSFPDAAGFVNPVLLAMARRERTRRRAPLVGFYRRRFAVG